LADAGSCDDRDPLDAGPCLPALTEIDFENGNFESGGVQPGWDTAPTPPQNAGIRCQAARTGQFGLELRDTSVGVPIIAQRIELAAAQWGKVATASAFAKAIGAPPVHLTLRTFRSNGREMIVQSERGSSTGAWEKLEVSAAIQADAAFLDVEVGSSSDGEGVAYVDDVVLCLDGRCSNACQ
jgi:hypothetical protein